VRPDADRLRRTLGSPDLSWLLARLRRRLERGRGLSGRLSYARPSAEQRAALDTLLGRRPSAGATLSVDLARLEAVVREAELAPTLREAVEVLTGPVADRRAEAAAQDEAWSAAFAEAAERLGERPELTPWLEALRAGGLVKRLTGDDVALGRVLLRHAVAVVERLPADGVLLAELAAAATGDAHALDRGAPLGTVTVRAAALLGGVESWEGAAARREAWARAGVLVDELSAPALVFNLRADPTTPSGRILAVHADAAEPCRLSARLLVRDPPRFDPGWTGPLVHVCENPSVVAAAADRLGARSAPLVCTEGQPATAVRLLLDRLTRAGIRLAYHGDFDWGGLHVANVVFRRHDALPWRFTALDYAGLQGALPLRGSPVAASWDALLEPELRRAGHAVHEEQVVEDVLADLADLAGDADAAGTARPGSALPPGPPIDVRDVLEAERCPRRAVYARAHPRREPAPTRPPWRAELREHLQDRYPGPDLGALPLDRARTATERALTEGPAAIHGARVAAQGVTARLDLLRRAPGADAWDLALLTPATSVGRRHRDALGLQLGVARSAGLRIARAFVVHVDAGGRGAGHDAASAVAHLDAGGRGPREDALAWVDLTADADARARSLAWRVAALRRLLARATEPPAVAPGPHCERHGGRPCPFLAECWRRDAPTLLDLPRLGPSGWALVQAGRERLADLEPSELAPRHRALADALARGERFVDPAAIRAHLEPWVRPLAFLDFEALVPALPRDPADRPYAPIPAQFSLRREGDPPLHRAHLHDDPTTDPRPAVARALLAALQDAPGSIVVYNRAYEATCLDALAAAWPSGARELNAARERLVDLRPVVEAGVYDRAFAGSYALDAVAAALLGPAHPEPDARSIPSGLAAAAALARLLDPRRDPQEATALREDLLAYCARDTQSLVDLLGWLRDSAAGPVRPSVDRGGGERAGERRALR